MPRAAEMRLGRQALRRKRRAEVCGFGSLLLGRRKAWRLERQHPSKRARAVEELDGLLLGLAGAPHLDDVVQLLEKQRLIHLRPILRVLAPLQPPVCQQ